MSWSFNHELCYRSRFLSPPATPNCHLALSHMPCSSSQRFQFPNHSFLFHSFLLWVQLECTYIDKKKKKIILGTIYIDILLRMITLTATTLWCHLVVSDSITVLVWCFEHWSYDILSTMLSVSSIRCVHACAFYILINPQDIFIFWPFNINNNNIIINFTYFFFVEH